RLGMLVDRMTAALPAPAEEKQPILDALVVEDRVELLLAMLVNEVAILQLEKNIQQQVQHSIDKNQRDYYLHEQMKAIADELGESDSPLEEAEELRAKVRELSLPEVAHEKLMKECDRLAKMPFGSHEASVIRNYLDTCLGLPWNTYSQEQIDLDRARKVLDRDHYGLQKVKERILELLAVRQLTGGAKGQVVCLVGPPGVGKTSIAKSIAESLGRTYVRVSLGGVKDESEIRGHRKTYIGSMPGRIIHAMTQAKTMNPLILLDEVDKLGHSFNGDPSSALLEVLDTEQNKAFNDHYLEIPFDLSQVLFITTANSAEDIPAPLYDRMDVITLSSYTAEEKFHIARKHLVKKQLVENGLTAAQLKIRDGALRLMIDGYTREGGVRNLQRCIATVCRKCAQAIVSGETESVAVNQQNLAEYLGPRKFKEDARDRLDEVGVVNGLAWTAVGGETMPIEVAILDGNGKIELTGSLGDVMKESARTAISYVRSRADKWNIEKDFYKTKDIHIHVPEGAVPKDGPSAGVTMATAMISALTGIPVRHDVAMTGEISLRGKVLPIGGLKEKTMAAYRHHMDTVVIPQDNESDLAEVDETVKKHLKFVTARTVDTVVETALVPH
ncbi:MAG: endopeptidase La, partial [Clostridia bacterium]|nr:endopeptidase La [Clostridia bacterium]